ncbi:MAG: DUF262 domain-containing protein [Candidatus Bathyarchaeota archaeon]|nr:DUF262 domain-containing protein [Candidatus Bathyarchaeota archaeon]
MVVDYNPWEAQVGDIKGQYDRGEIIPDPDWQRGYIWTLKDERLLIDSILRKIPIPKFYLTEEYDSKKGACIHYVVDGQQRIKAIYRFLNNEYTIEIGDKQYLFKDLDSKTQQKIIIYKLSGHYMVDFTTPDIVFLFERLNRTGIKLTNMELWNSRYYGTKILTLIRDIYENVFDFPTKRDYRDYDDTDTQKLQKSYVAAVYTEEQIKRMLPLDDIVDLLNCLHRGKVDSGNKADLESFLWSKKEIADAESIALKEKVKSIITNIKDIFTKKDLEDSLFSKRTHFISLLLAFGLFPPSHNISKNSLTIKKELLNFIENQPEDYKESVAGGIRHKERRELRVKYFHEIISKYSNKP